MKRTIYIIMMSAFAGTVIGGVVANLVNIMDPELQLDYGLSIAFFTAITWALLAMFDALYRKLRPAPSAPAHPPVHAPVHAPTGAPAASVRR
ncbi:MAG: hypothetical protein ACM30I_00785 [Gemmatimonas sp.]